MRRVAAYVLRRSRQSGSSVIRRGCPAIVLDGSTLCGPLTPRGLQAHRGQSDHVALSRDTSRIAGLIAKVTEGARVGCRRRLTVRGAETRPAIWFVLIGVPGGAKWSTVARSGE